MKKILIPLFSLIIACISFNAWAEPDFIQCVEDNKRILCTLTIPDFIKRAGPILTNGWENTFQINIDLLNSEGSKILQKTKLEATQRCYLDPFESPCLILWRGAKTWQRYNDEQSLLLAMSKFGIQALTLKSLPPDNYIIRINLVIMASAQKRVESIRNWFKQSTGSDSKTFSFSNGSLIGAFLGSKAETVDGNTMMRIELQTDPFYIDLNNANIPHEYDHNINDNEEEDTKTPESARIEDDTDISAGQDNPPNDLDNNPQVPDESDKDIPLTDPLLQNQDE